jgi:hypothetical protein
MVETPDGHGRLELTKFTPRRAGATTGTRRNTPGIRHVAFAIDDIDAVGQRVQMEYDRLGRVRLVDSDGASMSRPTTPSTR